MRRFGSIHVVLAASLTWPSHLVAGPVGSVVVGGDVAVDASDAANVVVTQQSQRGIVNWQDFSVGRDETVTFVQPNAEAVTANRVVGVDPSQILGQVVANGQLLLINPNGIVFGANAMVDSAAFVATTHNFNDTEFMTGTGPLRFSGAPEGAQIVNNGSLLVREGGIAALMSPQVINNGVIAARLGTVQLAASNGFSIDLYGDGMLSFAPGDALTATIGDGAQALITNNGAVRADGGTVIMTARAASSVINSSVNIEGIVQAQSVSEQAGVITLSGDGRIETQDGATIDVRGIGTSDGGSITVRGGSLAMGGAMLADGYNGGAIDIGTDGQLSIAGTISADGVAGNGGSVAVQARAIIENRTNNMSATGAQDGGQISVAATNGMMSSGSYDASGGTGVGGRIDVTAEDVRLLSAQFVASGAARGGLVRIGGAFQGGKDANRDQPYYDAFVTRWGAIPSLAAADRTFVNNATVVSVTSTDGIGGTAVIWSDTQTTFLGSIDARGGAGGGNAEISSADHLRRAALTNVNVGDGTLLLDPKNITIGQSAEVQSWSYSAVLGMWNYGGTEISLGANDMAGAAVSLSGDGRSLAIGAPNDDGFSGSTTDSGAVYLYNFSDGDYGGATLAGIIGNGYTGTGNVNVSALAAGDLFGSSVALPTNGANLAVGAPGDDGSSNSVTNAGAVYLFSFTNTSFAGGALEATIGADYSGGDNIDDTALEANDLFGSSLAMDTGADMLAIGATGDDGASDGATDVGAVYLYSFTGSDFSGGSKVGVIGDGYSGQRSADVSYIGAGDNFGAAVALNSDANRLAVGATGDDGDGDSYSNAGAVYLFTFTDTTFRGPSLAARIGTGYKTLANDYDHNLGASDSFGSAVAISKNADLLAIGTPNDDGSTDGYSNAGAVHLYSFGSDDFSSGSYAGTIGHGYTGSNSIALSGLEAGDNFGASLSMNGNGNRLAIGASNGDGLTNDLSNSGEVRLFSFSGSNFAGGSVVRTMGDGYVGSDISNPTGLAASEQFGHAVAMNSDATRIAVGSPYDRGSSNNVASAGAVYLYTFTDSDFGGASLAGVMGSGYTGGNNVNVSTLQANDSFGMSVALDGDADRLAVGVPYDDGDSNGSSNSGAVYLYSFGNTDFGSASLTARIGADYSGGNNLDLTDLDSGDVFGTSVALNDAGDRLVVGAVADDGRLNTTSNAGAAYLFTFTNTSFAGAAKVGTIGASYTTSGSLNMSSLGASDTFGQSVALDADGNRLAIGAPGDDGAANGGNGDGAVYLIRFADGDFGTPTLSATLGADYSGGNNLDVTAIEQKDSFGYAVALDADGDRLLVGAPTGDGMGNSASMSGDAYLFSFDDADFGGATLRSSFGKGYTGTNDVNLKTVGTNDYLGMAVALNNAGDRMAIGAPTDDGYGDAYSNSGAVYLLSGARASGGYAQTSADTFGDEAANAVTVNAYELSDLMTRGTDVTLQASNDITLSNALNVDSGAAVSSPGGITLQAGRSLNLNANISTSGGAVTLIGNELLSNGVVDANRDSGNAAITMAVGTAINAGAGDVTVDLRAGTGKTNTASGDITLNTITGGTITVTNNGPTSGSGVVIRSGAVITAADTGDAIVIAGDDFTNSAGSGALVTTDANGRFLVWSATPTADTRGGLAHDFKQYNAAYGVDTVSGGAAQDGFLYTTAPTITASLQGTTARAYDGGTTATLADANLTTSGAIDGDVVTVSAGSAAYASANVGTGLTVTASGLTIASAMNSAVQIYGYSMASTSASGAIGVIATKALSISGSSAANRAYDGGTSATVTAGTVTGYVTGESLNVAASGSFASANAANNINVATTYSLTDNGGYLASNYSLAGETLTADITPKTLAVTGTSANDKTYDGTGSTTVSVGTVVGLVGSETLNVTASGSFADVNVGTGKYVTVNYNLTDDSGLAANYSLANGGANAAITAKQLSVSGASVNSKIYDGSTSASVTGGTLTGLISGETINFTSSAAFASADAGTGKAATISYTLSDATGSASNYSIADASTTGTITPKALSISAPTAQSRVYDGTVAATVSAGTLSGLISGETLGVTATGSFASKSIGTGKAVSVTYNLSDGSGRAANYSLAAGSTNADVTSKALGLTTSTITTKTYDGTNGATIAGLGTLSGVVSGDTVTLDSAGASATFDSKNAGANKLVTLAGLSISGVDAGNYVLGATQASGTITPKALSITTPQYEGRAFNGSRVLDVEVGSLSGFVGAETIGVVANGLLDSAAAGVNKMVTISYNLLNGTNGGLAGNYSLANDTGTVDIEGDESGSEKQMARIMLDTLVEAQEQIVEVGMKMIEMTVAEEPEAQPENFVESMGQWQMLSCDSDADTAMCGSR